MKVFFARFSLAQSLVALVVSFALVFSASIMGLASPAKSSSPAKSKAPQTDGLQSELQLTSATATAVPGGVLLHWRTNSTTDNVGFNVYRVKDGQRTLANRNIIPGAVFAPSTPEMRGGYSYAWFDRGGTANSIYVIESIKVDGSAKTHQALSAVAGKTPPGLEEMPESLTGPSTPEANEPLEKYFPAVESQLSLPPGVMPQQWAVAGQTSLKIAIKKDGWYRITQPQMVAAGFNPTVDIRNLRLFADGNEVAIATNQFSGAFRSTDYIEFYGRGLDTPTADTRTYYLIAGTTPGKRVTGDIQLDSPPVDPPPPPPPTATPPVTVTPTAPVPSPVLRDPIFHSDRVNVSVNLSWIMNTNPKSEGMQGAVLLDRPDSPAAPETTPTYSRANSSQPVERPATDADEVEANRTLVETAEDSVKKLATPETTPLLSPPVLTRSASPVPAAPGRKASKAGKARRSKASRKKAKRKPRRQLRKEYSHAVFADGFAATNFDNTYQFKGRSLYFSTLQNGEEENFFGQVIASPVTLTLPLPNPDIAAAGTATLEFALQGVANLFGNSHQVSVSFNNVTVGLVDFGALDHPVSTFSIPASQILNGANTLKFTKTSSGEICIFDYVRLTYPHAFKTDSGSLKFSLLGSQTRTVDGFAGPSVRLIDYSDPLAVKVTRPASEPSALGYAITVPASESGPKNQRLLLAIPEGQFDQPESLTLNQPSTLNLNSNNANFVIVSYKDFIPSFTANILPANTSLVGQRTAQGHRVKIVDIEDVYDEFGFGAHGPQAIKNFLQHASTHWATPPAYVIFAGDASLDPRNYTGAGNFDLVPTKLLDATYDETCSDDWLTDFDNDGIANIPVGRLPFRTTVEASLILSKIVNFTPLVPQNALLVADFQGTYYFSFTGANDEVQAILANLVLSMPVFRINRPDSANVEADVINKMNEGQALVAYSGHGSVDVWSASFSAAGATGLTNGNKLSFVVVMDCLNGYYQDPTLISLSEALLRAPNGGAVAAFASSGRTLPDGQHHMSLELFSLLYGPQPIAIGDAIKLAKNETTDIDVRHTWVFFGDPSMKIR